MAFDAASPEPCADTVAAGIPINAASSPRSIAPRIAALFVEPSEEHLHFLLRLYVAGALRGGDAVAPCPARLRRITGFDQRAAEEFPRRRIFRIELDGSSQLRSRLSGFASGQQSVTKGKTQQGAVARAAAQAAQALDRIVAHAGFER
jgi:hypothetical protein